MADKTCIALFDYQGDGELPTGCFFAKPSLGGGVIVSLSVFVEMISKAVLSLSLAIR